MGRLPMGDEGRSVKATLRITPQERAALVERFGSEGKGLRALLDEHMQRGRYGARTTFPGEEDLVQREEAQVLADMAAAVALDQVKQALPIGEHEPEENLSPYLPGETPTLGTSVEAVVPEGPLAGTIAAGVDSPDGGLSSPVVVAAAIAAEHRHRRGALLHTEFDRGTKVKVFACAVEGCAVELR